MKLRSKMIIGASILTAVPVILASILISVLASNNSATALHDSAQARLVAARDITRRRIEGYFSTIQKQVETLSVNPMVGMALT